MTMTAFSPIQWLLDLQQKPDGYRLLLGIFGGDIVLAGHRLAVVKCMAASNGELPTSRELYAAVQEIGLRTGWLETYPTKREAEIRAQASGLAVI